MKFVSVRELKLKTKDVWDKLDKEGIVLIKNGKPFALLTPVNETQIDKEINAIARAKALLALDEIHKNSLEKKVHNLKSEEIEKEIRAIRRMRHG